MTPTVKSLEELLIDKTLVPQGPWELRAIIDEDSLCYLVWNKETKEGLIIDPVMESVETTFRLACAQGKMKWLVFDTHTHADHISGAAEISRKLNVPLIMHEKAPSKKVDLRVSRDIHWQLEQNSLQILYTPGHTSDGMCLKWGPFLFTGDLILFDDTGRDDLPTGEAAAHFDSLEKIRKQIPKETLVLPGHDSKGGRVASLESQLKSNPSFLETREQYISGSEAFTAPPPKRYKESILENCK